MKNIYLFDEYISSLKNGIGTYLRELLYCLQSPEYNINLIIFNASTKEFKVVEKDHYKAMLFPPLEGHFLKHVQVVDKLLRLYIKDDSNNIFFVNHSPCKGLLESLKKNFPYSKVVFTIHDFGWTSPLMGNLKELKYLLKSHSPYIEEMKKTEENFVVSYFIEEKEMYQLADKVICLSQDSYTILRLTYGLNEDKISLIPNGLQESKQIRKSKNVDELRISLNIRGDEKILVTIGRPTRQKGIFDLIEAMKLVLKIHQNVRLVIIGDANEQSFRQLIKIASALAPSVTFTGLLDRSQIYRWLSVADIGVIPSYYEQFGFAGVEMMMHGLSIVASDGVGVRNMFKDKDNAKIAKIGNRKRPKEYQRNLANAIVELLNSPDICHDLSVVAREMYEEKYHIRYMKQKYNELIHSL